MSEMLPWILMGVLLLIPITLFSLLFYCKKNTVKWLSENGKYFNINTALTFLSPFMWLFILGVIVIEVQTLNALLICIAIEIALIIMSVIILIKIAKKNPPKSLFKISMLMIGCSWGYGFNMFLKFLGKGIDIAAELELKRQNRIYSVERYCATNSIKYQKISENGYSYIDENGEKQDVDFRIYDMYTLF